MDQGNPIVFTAKLNTVVPTANLEFNWQLSAGTITAGEGTASITVDTVGLGGQDLAATVEVFGLSTTCSTVATRSVSISQVWPGCNLPFDQYGDIRFDGDQPRLDNFAIELLNQKTSKGYIFVYAGRRTYAAEAAERLLRAKDSLVKVRKMDTARVITIDGGYMEDFYVDLIIAPPGAAPPYSMPTLSPTEIELTKPRPRDLVKRKIRKRT